MELLRTPNWNRKDNPLALMMWKQNTNQFWLDEEFAPNGDKDDWNAMSKAEKTAYKKVLAGLTRLDGEQGGEGMPLISIHVKDELVKAVLSFMGTMEHVHSKSYSTIFTTLCNEIEIDEVFKWADENPYLVRKAQYISCYYRELLKPDVSEYELFMAMCASVLLESFLFYSGFFFPLYLAGQGKMVASGEIINLILRDEAIHGAYIGVLARDIFAKFDRDTQNEVRAQLDCLLIDLYANELEYTDEVYGDIGLSEQVKDFLEYNANRAYQNLGFDAFFEEKEINPIVENGIKTDTKNHDFFSVKGNGYVVTTNIKKLTDESFRFPNAENLVK